MILPAFWPFIAWMESITFLRIVSFFPGRNEGGGEHKRIFPRIVFNGFAEDGVLKTASLIR